MTPLTSPQAALLIDMARLAPGRTTPSWHIGAWTHKQSPYTLATLRECICLGLVMAESLEDDRYRITHAGLHALEAGWTA